MPTSKTMLLLLEERKKCNRLEAVGRKDKSKCIRLEEEALQRKRDLLIKDDEMKQLKDDVGKWMFKCNMSHAWAAAGNLQKVGISEEWKQAIRLRFHMKTTGTVAARLTNGRRELSDLRDQMQYNGGKNAGSDLDSEASQSAEDAPSIVAGDDAPEDDEEEKENADISGGDEDDHNIVAEEEDNDDFNGEGDDNNSDEEADSNDSSSSNPRTSDASSQEEEEPPKKRRKTISPLTSSKVAKSVLPVSRARPPRPSVPLQAQPSLTPQSSRTVVEDEDKPARLAKRSRLAPRIPTGRPSMLAKLNQILHVEKAAERKREILRHPQRLQHGSGVRECDTRSFDARSRPFARPLFGKGVAGSWRGCLE